MDALRSVDNVALLKLHGCISLTHDETLPLILTTDQYVTYLSNRDRLFTTFKEWAYENTLVTVGQRLQDPDLRQVLLELSARGDMRPRYYFVAPNVTPEETRFWEGRRVTPLPGSFEDFLEAIAAAVPPLHRIITPSLGVTHPIGARLRADAILRTETLEFITIDADYVYPGMPTARVAPPDFYRGVNEGWGPIEQNLDVRRRLIDRILIDVVLQDEADKASSVEFVVVKAEAGAGKSVSLKRIAWEASNDVFCLSLRPGGRLQYEAIEELTRLSDQRLFLFLDDAADYVEELLDVLRRAKLDRLKLTVVSAERVNEWNIACERLESHVTSEYELRYLSRDEISQLIDLLDRHTSLGRLAGRSKDENIEEFQDRAGRQILVALLEATQGIPLADILVNEFNNIVPASAQALYLTVCVLNRLGIPVRAGLIEDSWHSLL